MRRPKASTNMPQGKAWSRPAWPQRSLAVTWRRPRRLARNRDLPPGRAHDEDSYEINGGIFVDDTFDGSFVGADSRGCETRSGPDERCAAAEEGGLGCGF